MESLEPRTLLSAVGGPPGPDVHFDHAFFDPTTHKPTIVPPKGLSTLVGPSSVRGFLFPADIRKAYGIDRAIASGWDGTGQTIAIVDAGDDPSLVSSVLPDGSPNPAFAKSDLAMFDARFGLPDPPTFLKVDQNGVNHADNPSLYPVDWGWSTEEALDVEWAHSIAPGADIILVEANDPISDALFTAVATAASLPGVSVVSNSWGTYGEFYGEQAYDSYFTTPSGHQGVTFLASAGDYDAPGGYPAYSPNVVAVGGTTLDLNLDGTYNNEVVWNDGIMYGTGGGQSFIEKEPAYQEGVQQSGWRQMPDVAFDADPASGVAVLDTDPAGGVGGWVDVGGTSLSSPCWGGLIAMINQANATQGVPTMDGPSQTLPYLYDYFPQNSDQIGLPSTDFHDITVGNNSSWFSVGYSAGPGYDMCTGLGTPIANRMFNHAPVLNSLNPLSLRTIAEQSPTNFGTRITTMLQSGGGNPVTDADNDPLGIAVIGTNTVDGAWQYTTDNGMTWRPLGRVSNASARLLAADTATRIRFIPNPGFSGFLAPAITFRAWDQAIGANGDMGNATKNGGLTAFSTATGTASITITPVNHAPSLDPSVALSLSPVNENQPRDSIAGSLVSDILASGVQPAITDVETGDPQGIAVTSVDNTHGDWDYTTDGINWFPLDPLSLSPSSALLLAPDAHTRLRFTPKPGFFGTVAAGVGFRAWDQTSGTNGDTGVDTTDNGGSTAFSTNTSAISVTVNWINESPILSGAADLTMAPMLENDFSNEGTLVSDLLTSAGSNPITDPDGGSTPNLGIAVFNADTTNGAWQYTTDGGAHWAAVGTLADGSLPENAARLLAADADTRLRFVPNLDFNGTVDRAFSFRAWDRSAGTNGGTADATVNGGAAAFSVSSGTISLNVIPVNQPPSFVKGPDVQVLENCGEQKVPGWASSISPGPANESSQIVDFLVSSDDPSLFSKPPIIDGQSGDLRFVPASDTSGVTTVTVRAQDDGGINNGGQDTSDPQTFTITVQWVNSAPSFNLPNPAVTVPENSPLAVVPAFAQNVSSGAGDPDQRLNFLMDDSNPALFLQQPVISAIGTLTYQLAPDTMGTATVTVRLHDDGGTANGGSDTSQPQTFTIRATPVNEPPEVSAQQLSTDASQAIPFTLAGTVINRNILTSLTYAITSQPQGGKITSFDPVTGQGVYTPTAGFNGMDTLTFTATADFSAGQPSTVTSAAGAVQIWVNPVVQVPSGAGANNLVLHRILGRASDGSQDRLQLDLVSGRTTQTLFSQLCSSVHKLTVVGAAGQADQLTVDFTGGSVLLPEGLVFDGGPNGGGTLAVRGTSGPDSFVLASGQVTADNLAIAFQHVGQVRLDGGAGNDTYVIKALDVPVQIVDSSGVDTLDFSQSTYNSGINLNLNLTRGQPQQVIAGHGTLALRGIIENVIGTPYDDVIRGNSANNRIWGGGGNDTLYAGGGNDILYGGDGNDTLVGGRGNAVLVGGPGNNTLYAGTGRTVLIGGAGKSVLTGSSGDTILIAGSTKYDANDAALTAILAEWSSGRPFARRVALLRSGIGANRSVYLRLNDSVFDNGLQDQLIAGKGKDWFLDFSTDVIQHRGRGDVVGAARPPRKK